MLRLNKNKIKIILLSLVILFCGFPGGCLLGPTNIGYPLPFIIIDHEMVPLNLFIDSITILIISVALMIIYNKLKGQISLRIGLYSAGIYVFILDLLFYITIFLWEIFHIAFNDDNSIIAKIEQIAYGIYLLLIGQFVKLVENINDFIYTNQILILNVNDRNTYFYRWSFTITVLLLFIVSILFSKLIQIIIKIVNARRLTKHMRSGAEAPPGSATFSPSQ